MAKRKNKLLLSDLFPELAAEREVAEEEEREREREREEPARKARKVSKNGRRLPEHMQPGPSAAQEEKWNARLEVCKEWKRTKGRFPKANKKDKEEQSLYDWLKDFKFGGRRYTQARWEKLNEAFGEGWEKECFPYLGIEGFLGQVGQQFERDEAQWDAILEAVKLFKRTHGRFPRRHGGDADERRLYDWLQKNMDTTSHYYTHERANKLVLAFDDSWQAECFPKSMYAR